VSSVLFLLLESKTDVDISALSLIIHDDVRALGQSFTATRISA
jgi:hypothetical protein